jgi:hypothetical protein
MTADEAVERQRRAARIELNTPSIKSCEIKMKRNTVES